MLECVSPGADEVVQHHGRPSQSTAQPYRQSHEGGIVDLLFLGPYFKIITVDVVMLLRQGISGPKLGPSNFSIHKETVYFCLNTLMSY